RSRGVAQFIAPLPSFVKRFYWPPDRFAFPACQSPGCPAFTVPRVTSGEGDLSKKGAGVSTIN
ncbi:MAG: hypothetical protein AB7T74_17285, partial [Clostridia bacterium]